MCVGAGAGRTVPALDRPSVAVEPALGGVPALAVVHEK